MHSKILVAFIALVVAAQACCCCTAMGGPQPPYTITPSDEHVQNLEERMESVDIAPDGSFNITVTEEELTSLLVHLMEQQQAEQSEQPPISDPQILIRNGRVELYATVHIVDGFSLPGLVAFTVDVTDRQATVTVEEVAVGPVPMPEAIEDALANLINEVLAESTQTETQGDAIITDVEVGDREVTLYCQMIDQ
jgi:hypothetical protein